MSELTPKQKLFCEEYLKDLNGAQAAIRAGYSKKTARNIAQENLTKPNIADYISSLMESRSKRVLVDADSLLEHLQEESQADLADLFDDESGELRPIRGWPLIWRQGLVSSIDVDQLTVDGQSIGTVAKVKLADRTRIRENIGRHVNVQAFKEKIEVDVKGELVPWSEIEAGEDGD